MVDTIVTVAVCVVIAAVALFFFLQSRRTRGGEPTLSGFQLRQKQEIERLQARGEYLTAEQAAAWWASHPS